MRITESKVKEIIREELLNEFTTTGIDVPRIVSLRRPVKKRSKAKGLCCGAGGAQMFKEPEAGNKDINILRTEDAIETAAEIIATGCPFCNTMMTDGVKAKEKEGKIEVLDVAELLAKSI